MKSNPVLLGAGWIEPRRCGRLRSDKVWSLQDDLDLDQLGRHPDLFPVRPKNYARFDRPSRLTCCAVALALLDAEHAVQPDAPQPIGILGSHRGGSQTANRAYFDDYLACGRTLGRGNLFIYTLPTSPLAESAIHFKLGGPCFHVTPAQAPLSDLLAIGTRLIQDSQCREILLVVSDDNSATALLLGPVGAARPGLCPADEAHAFLRASPAGDSFLWWLSKPTEKSSAGIGED